MKDGIEVEVEMTKKEDGLRLPPPLLSPASGGQTLKTSASCPQGVVIFDYNLSTPTPHHTDRPCALPTKTPETTVRYMELGDGMADVRMQDALQHKASAPPAKRKHVCRTCHKSFKRTEHLARHERAR